MAPLTVDPNPRALDPKTRALEKNTGPQKQTTKNRALDPKTRAPEKNPGGSGGHSAEVLSGARLSGAARMVCQRAGSSPGFRAE